MSVLASAVGLIEREAPLEVLAAAHADVRGGLGRLVFVSGDAGIGKTALVREFCAAAEHARVLTGACDDLRTPRPLAPFADLGLPTDGKPQTVFDALEAELRAQGADVIVVLEDLHWSDEATLDVLSMVGRRVERLGALVIATYRSDQLTRTHPLRILLGDFASAPGIVRLALEPFSRGAVGELARRFGRDGAHLHATTGGNPFFVTEVLASESTEIPPTVRDAVLARAARLSSVAHGLLDVVAIVPQRTELALLEAIAGESIGALDECLTSGMLTHAGHAVAFRHELARLAFEETISPRRRVELHRAAVRALRSTPDGRADFARLAHHADAAGDGAAVLELAVPAAEHAAAVGAHREAAAQLARALRYADALPLTERAALFERRSFECYLTDQQQDAISTLEQALECYRAAHDRRGEGLALCRLSRRRWCAGDTSGAETAALAGVSVLEGLGGDEDLAYACAVASSAFMNREAAEPAFYWGTRALELLDQALPSETLVFVLNNLGTMKLLLGDRAGVADLERSISLATLAGLEDHVARGYLHLGWAAGRARDFELVDRLGEGVEYALEHGLELWRLYLITYRARAALDRGRWAEAADGVSVVLRQPQSAPLLRVLALTILGVVRARRGDPDTDAVLDEAAALAAGRHLQHLAPVAIARAEVAAYAGDAARAAAASDDVLAVAQDSNAAWVVGELAYWRRRAGIVERVPERIPAPFALHLEGDFAASAERWRELGCPYEAALALAETPDGAAVRAALDELRALGAAPAAELVARRLRERGERGVARGPRPATRGNPRGLTMRELEVLDLVAAGLRNSEIAERLFLSARTVDHHVSAILRKLEVRTRAQASSEAVRLGVAQDR